MIEKNNIRVSLAIAQLEKLPEQLQFEVCDFIDFMAAKHEKAELSMISKTQDTDITPETAFSDYLTNLNNYEHLLAEGKIKW
ncbi:MAG: hypothetical protein HW421_2062 [Ignavibacteria bacterium]|nr:hypothetical protein [Ignavibacteria bacterium]